MADPAQLSPAAAELIRGQRAGSLIGAVFGLIYLEVNAGPLPALAALLLRIGGLAAFAAVLLALVRGRPRTAREQPASDSPPSGPNALFGRSYWLVVAAEAAALVAGLALLGGPLHTPGAGVAWVSFVVGMHFLPLAAIFGVRLFAWLGVAIAACGAAGLALAATAAPDAPIAVVSGIVPGALLLASAWYGTRTRPDPEPGS